MHIESSQPLFAWDALEDSPSIRTLQRFLAAIPDGALLEGLRQHRGRGRGDYPVHVLWGVLLLTAALRHTGPEACLRELKRNADLRRLLGLAGEHEVPNGWNISRFLSVLGQEPHRTRLKQVFDALIQRLGQAVPDLGKDTAGDSTALHARRQAGAEEATSALPQPSGGRKEYCDEEGQVTRIVEWFGYKLHLLVDVKHEVALAYEITSAHAADNETLPALVEQARGNLPENRIKTLAYDKAADDGEVHKLLDRYHIKPLIQTRKLWKEELERLLPGHDGRSNIVYDEMGTLWCYDRTSTPMVRHRMAYIGHEPARGTLKYRCPARHEGWPCPSEAVCNAGKKYGKTVRVDQKIDLRRFPPLPRATKKFERMYKGRTAVERVNARIKLFWGADDGNVVGAERFHAQVGTVMVVHAASATLLAAAPRADQQRPRTLGGLHLGPIQKALQAAGVV